MSRKIQVASVAVGLLAAILGGWGLGRWPLTPDEAYALHYAHASPSSWWDPVQGDRHPPLWTAVLSLTEALHRFAPTGEVGVEVWARAPAMLAWLAAVLLLAAAGGSRGRWAAGWMTLTPLGLLYAHQARMYGLLMLAGSALVVGALRLADGRPRMGGALVVLGASVALWAHAAGAWLALTGLSAAAVLLWRSPVQRSAWWALGGACLVAAAGFVPWVNGPLGALLDHRDVAAERTPRVLAFLLWAADDRVWGLDILWVVAQGVALARAVLRRRPVDLFLAVWALSAVLGMLLLSGSKPAQNPRVALGFLPAMALLVAELPDSTPAWSRRAWAWAALGAGLAVGPVGDLLSRDLSPADETGSHDRREGAALLASLGGVDFEPDYVEWAYDPYAALGPPSGAPWVGRPVEVHPRDSSGVDVPPEQGACWIRGAVREVLVRRSCDTACCEGVWAELSRRPWTSSPVLRSLAAHAVAQGALNAALSFADSAVASARRHPSNWGAVQAFQDDARLLSRAGRADDAAQVAQEGAELAGAYRLPPQVIADLWTLAGRPRRARCVNERWFHVDRACAWVPE